VETAVVLFAYNRPHYLKKALKTHKRIAGLKYYAFVDYSDKQDEIISLVMDSGIYHEIVPRTYHYGLDRNITEGITEVFKKHDAVIVLEDDLLLDENGIRTLLFCLYCYEYNYGVGSFSLYHSRKQEFQSWAWATYKWVWDYHKYIKGRGTQAQQFKEFHKKNKLKCITPDKHKVKHIGWKGEHFSWLDIFSIRRLWRKYVL